MSRYYLMAQLPSLDAIGDSQPMPITEQRFLELCDRFLDKKVSKQLHSLTLVPSRTVEKSGSELVNAFYEGERNLRLALACLRAQKLKKSFDADLQSLPSTTISAAHAAMEQTSPLEAEILLNQYRLELLEDLRPTDAFAQDSVFYYALKLKLVSRIKHFNKDSGENAYKNIYSSIVNNDGLEVEQ